MCDLVCVSFYVCFYVLAYVCWLLVADLCLLVVVSLWWLLVGGCGLWVAGLVYSER